MQRFVSFGTCRYLCFPHLGGSEPPRWVNWRQQRMNLLQTKGGFWLRTKKVSGRGLEVIQIHIETTTTNCRFLMKPSKTMVLEFFGIQRFLGNNFCKKPPLDFTTLFSVQVTIFSAAARSKITSLVVHTKSYPADSICSTERPGTNIPKNRRVTKSPKKKTIYSQLVRLQPSTLEMMRVFSIFFPRPKKLQSNGFVKTSTRTKKTSPR